MNKQEKDIYLIDLHLSGKLTSDEQAQFNERMKDPDFEKKLSLMKELVVGVKAKTKKDFKESLRKQEEAIQRKEKQLPFRRNIIAAAAAISLLLFTLWWISQPKSIDYFAEYFSPQENTIVIPEKSQPFTSLELEVFRDYDNKNYESALSGFNQLLSKDGNPDYKFFEANTLLALDRTDEAINILESLLDENKTQFLLETKWVLALSYLKKEDFKAAEPLLQELSSGYYKDKANEILKDVRF